MMLKTAFFAAALLLLMAGGARAEVLSLKDGLRLALKENRAIKISAEDVALSRADSEAARAPLLPDIRAGLSQTYLAEQPAVLMGAGSTPTSERDFFSYGVSLQQTVYDFGGSISRYGAGRVSVEAKRFDAETAANRVAVEFVNAYLDLLEAERMVTVLEKETERLTAHTKNAEKLYAEGVITKNDFLQASVRLADARQRLLAGRNARLIGAARINNMLARPLDMPVNPVESLSLGMESPWMESPFAEALKNRPEVKSLDAALRASALREDSKRSEYYPRFFLRGGYDFTENRYQLHEGNWSVTAGMSMSLFSGGATNAELKRLKSGLRILEEQRAKLLDDIRLQVEMASLGLSTARERLPIAKEALGQAEENLRIARVRYEAGDATGADVLDAVVLLTVSETNYYRALYDIRRAEAAVLYASGKDFMEVYK